MRIQTGRIVAFHEGIEKDTRQPARVLAANNNPAKAGRARHVATFPAHEAGSQAILVLRGRIAGR
jgi:hypothetical protein